MTEIASTTTEPTTECGNEYIEDDEECDGTNWNGTTCESLGFSGTGLTCANCLFDVSECGPPHGMIEVPGGTFQMGSSDYADEMPIRKVQVDRFYIDETEVTVESYTACVDAGGCDPPEVGAYCNWTEKGRENHPVNCVTWFHAEDYCGWADGGTKRLPTEAEWEKAARGTDAREYPWGNDPAPSCSHVVMDEGGTGCGMGLTWAVGSKPQGDSPYGAHDMAGNVWEWVADWYADTYDATETDNPVGPEIGSLRVMRGGPWNESGTYFFRTSHRNVYLPAGELGNLGFRCARTPPGPL